MSTKNMQQKGESKDHSVNEKVNENEVNNSQIPTGKLEKDFPRVKADISNLLKNPVIKAEIERQEKIIGEKLRENITEELTQKYKEKISDLELKAQEKISAKIQEMQEKNKIEIEHQKKFLLEKNVADLINIIDHFAIALGHIEKNAELSTYASGFRMIMNLFEKWLSSVGVVQIEINLGDQFNPQTMSAIEQVNSNLPKDSIVSVIRRGYKMYDKVVRVASVTVSDGKEKNFS